MLPKELRLGAPPTMPQARSYLFRQQSTLSAYNPDDQIQINIPRLQRSYLSKDSYLEFRLNGQFKPGTPAVNGSLEQMVPDLFLDDAGAWSVFERLEVFDYLGSTVLESIDSLPQLMSLLIDMGSDFTDNDHKGPAIHGLGNSYTATNQNDTSINYAVKAVSTPAQATGPPYQMSRPKIDINGATYTWDTTLTYQTMDEFIAALNVFLETTNTDVFAEANPTYGRAINLYKNGSTFTTNTTSGATGTASLINYLGIPASLTTASTYNVNIVSSSGVGKSFYCGGIPLVTFGTTRSVDSPFNAFSLNFCIPLPSFLGFLSNKMVPLHNGFTIVLTIASKFKPMFMAPKQVPVLTAAPLPGQGTASVVPDVRMQVLNAEEPSYSTGSQATNINRPDLLPDPAIFWWNITDVNMVCHILELGPVAESMILSSTQGQPLIVHTKQLRTYRGNTSKQSAEFSLPLNLNVASLTNILWFMRPDGTENNLRFASIGARVRNYLQRWEFQYGSTVLPQSQGIKAMEMSTPIVPSGITTPFTQPTLMGNSLLAGFGETFSELLKSRPTIPEKGRLTFENFNAYWYNGKDQWVNFGYTPWRCTDGRTGTASPTQSEICKFACGLNTELVTGKYDLICGLNTNGMNTTIRGYFHPNYVSSTVQKFDCVIDAYAEYDAFVNISPGIATTISF